MSALWERLVDGVLLAIVAVHLAVVYAVLWYEAKARRNAGDVP